MNWTYFNVAPEDQQMDEFWSGSETFRLTGMHPKKPAIESRLPGIRHRFFVNQLTDLKKPDGETNFREILAHLDTVWFFPHAEKGIVIYRGSVEIKDDEALDVPHLYIVSEYPAQQPGTLEHYHDQFKKSIDRSIAADITPQMNEAKKDLEELADTLKDLPLQINDAVDRGLGRAPRTAKTPAQVAVDSIARIDSHQKMLADGHDKLLELKNKFGHLVKIDTSSFEKTGEILEDAKGKIAAMPGIADRVKKNSAETLKNMKDKFDKNIGKHDFSKFEDVHIDIAGLVAPFDEKMGNPWHVSGMLFLEQCRDRLKRDPDMIAAFRSLGFRPYTLERSWLGVNRESIRFDRKEWGLEPSKDDPEDPQGLIIPAGLLIPCFDGPDLKKITVRPIFNDSGPVPVPRLCANLVVSLNDSLVDGSADQALAAGTQEGKPFVCVKDPLEAIFLNQELAGYCASVAMKDPTVKTGKDLAQALKKAPQLLVISYPEQEKPEIGTWKTICPDAQFLRLPRGKDLFEAKNAGVDIWQWIYDALRGGLRPLPETKPREVDVSEPGAVASLVPTINVESINEKIKDDLKSMVQPKLDLMEAKDKEAQALLAAKLEKKGHNLDELLKRPNPNPIPPGANPYAAAKDMYAERFTETRRIAKEKGLLSPAVENKLSEVEKSANEILSESAKMYYDGMARLASLESQTAAFRPGWAKKLLANAGFDPDDPDPLKALTREEVIERHAKGLNLTGKNMAGIDLSGLDLSGVSLRRANIQGTNFKSAVLDGADLSGSIAREADFSQTSMKGAVMTSAMLLKAKFPGADLAGADMSQSMMSEADMTGTNLTGAIIVRTLLEKAVMKKARAHDANASQIYLLSADITGADFSGANLTRGVFLKTNIEGANFSQSTLREAAFLETRGNAVDFTGADMHNSRILGGSAIKDSNFTNIEADRASWMKSDLSGGDFRGAKIERGLLQECDLSGSNLSGINAKMSRITKSNLSDSNLKEINLFQGSLRKSKLVRTDLTRANLYGTEFYRTGVGETKLDEANLKMTKLYKRTDLIPEAPKDKKK
ncbi:MAG: pentapeptide repeat-containing protein, partial [Syntrophorhabdaceae bacterium]